MLNVIISDSAKDSLMRLANFIKAMIKANRLNADVKFLSLRAAGVLNAPVADDDICLFILEFHMKELQLYQTISEKYRYSSILFFSPNIDAMTLKASLTGNIRPSGFLEKPLKAPELQEAFMEVYACYLNRIQDEVVNASSGGRMYMIPLRDIIYFESIEKKVNVVTKSQCISYYASMYGLENDYSKSFVRCHKSYLANLQKIRTALFDEMTLVMDNGAKLPVSRTYKNSVKLRLTPKK